MAKISQVELGYTIPRKKMPEKNVRFIVALEEVPDSLCFARYLQKTDQTKNGIFLVWSYPIPASQHWCCSKRLRGIAGDELFTIRHLLSHRRNIAKHSIFYCYFHGNTSLLWKYILYFHKCRPSKLRTVIPRAHVRIIRMLKACLIWRKPLIFRVIILILMGRVSVCAF